MFDFFNGQRDVNKRLKDIEEKIIASFKIVREEFEDHLDAINENTNELQQHLNYFEEINSKIEKLSEKVEQLQMMINQINQTTNKSHFSLTEKEQAVFLALYSIDGTPLSYGDLSRELNMPELAIKAHIYSLINKGIPIVSKMIDGTQYFKLDKNFKEKQAKEYIVKIDQNIIKQIKPIINPHF